MALYYDNPTSLLSPEGCVSVERVYALHFAQFGEAEWKQLLRTFEALPAWQAQGEHGCSCWFNRLEESPYLLASVEPSGLLVTGVLGKQEWEQWNSEFVANLPTLPTFEV
ncbi:hypothetical protein [Piscinibacter terrae]|uniref:Uncharacterized protein n=1 Tax=Piscinibacter terrae TaxID=2496871 RepID=A0A3N7JQ25_9BURK|nr:hypothetical protein [Albitalea terrae]RQP21155.1 hypothetical protein DZC73_29285 [Albitalea terrae]